MHAPSVVVVLDAIDRPPSHSQLVYQRLKQVLQEGGVSGGSLLSEADLARQLGVSTTPVHEAVVRLAAEGFVEALPRRGVRVVHLTPKDIAEIFELREALEVEVVRLALVRASDDDLASLQPFLDAGQQALERDDYPAFNAADVGLHDALAAAVGNRRLQQNITDLRVWVQRIRFAAAEQHFGLPTRPARALAEHTELVRALERRDAAAEGLIRKHIGSLKDDILAYMASHDIEFI
jgi:DNA-binding GntR family transcriptional regulator